MPTLIPVDFDPFYEATGADKPEQPKPQAKLLANTLFGAIPFLGPVLGHESVRNSFMEGFNKSGGAGLKSMGEALENQYVPEGAVKFDDAGQYYDKDGKPLFTQRRPNLVPLTKDEKGSVELAIPAMADVWNTLGGPGGATLGAGPSLRPALKYMDKIYKAKPGEQHLDAIPKELQDTFQKQALSGEDISNFNFGFINHKGHFLQREDALKYAIDHGILDPNDAKYGALVTTMLNKSGGEGKIASTFFSALEDNLNKINQNKASGDQWLSTLQNAKGVKGEELEWTGLKDFLKDKKNVSKAEIEEYLKGSRVEINDVWKGTEKPLTLDQVKKLASEGKPFHAIDPRKPNEIASVTLDNGQLLPYAEKNFNNYIFKSGSFEDAVNLKGNSTKYHDYQLPGGNTNYRELLLTLPVKTSPKAQEALNLTKRMNDGEFNSLDDVARKELFAKRDKLLREAREEEGQAYKSSHWDEPNILAHMRMNDRTIDGKKSLHLEEIQSDWHQQGREKGYNNVDAIKQSEKIYKVKDAPLAVKSSLRERGFDLNKIENEDVYVYGNSGNSLKEPATKETMKEWVTDGVPDAPFKKTWHELALKRAIREAAENGYEQLSWTPGEAQAARYDLSKQVDKIAVPMVSQDGATRSVRIDAKQGTPFKLMVDNKGIVDGSHSSSQFSGKHLSDVVGKEMAEKIMKLDKPNEFTGDGLKIGGEGMKGFYDNIIPKSVEKIAKEFGVKVQKGEVGSNKIPDNFDIENTGGGWRVVDMSQNQGQGTFIGPIHRSGADAEKWLKEQGHMKQPIFYIDIPPAMRQAVMQKGQPLFSGTPTLTPVNYNPFEEETK